MCKSKLLPLGLKVCLPQEVDSILQYSRDLAHLAGEPGMPAGLGRVTIYGGRLEADNRMRELRDVYRYLPYPPSTLGPLSELQVLRS